MIIFFVLLIMHGLHQKYKRKNDDVFNSTVQVNGVNIGVGSGINKKLAEQQPVKSAMKKNEPDKK